jgi:hypothetical protein
MHAVGSAVAGQGRGVVNQERRPGLPAQLPQLARQFELRLARPVLVAVLDHPRPAAQGSARRSQYLLVGTGWSDKI